MDRSGGQPTEAIRPLPLEVEISTNVLSEPPMQLDLRAVMAGDGACTVADLKHYLCQLAHSQMGNQQGAGLGGGGSSGRVPLPEGELVVERAYGGRGQLLFDHHSLLHEHDSSAPVGFTVRVRHRTLDLARDAAERRFQDFDSAARFGGYDNGGDVGVGGDLDFDDDEDDDYHQGRMAGLASDPISGDRGLGRPEEFFHEALERFDAALSSSSSSSSPSSSTSSSPACPNGEGGDNNAEAVFAFIEDCLQDQKTRFETVANASQTTSDRAAALLAAAAAGCPDDDGSGAAARGGRSGGGGSGGPFGRGGGRNDPKKLSAAGSVARFSRAMRDEYATWELLGVLHHHRLLAHEDDSTTAAASNNNNNNVMKFSSSLPAVPKRSAQLLALSDKEVVRQLVTLDEDDEEVAQRVGGSTSSSSSSGGGQGGTSAAAASQLVAPGRCYPCSRRLLRVAACRRWLEHTFRTTSLLTSDFRVDRLNKESRWAKTQQGLVAGKTLGFSQAAHNKATASAVASLDPDAPLHTIEGGGGGGGADAWLSLAPLDSEDERDLLADVWRLVRAGQLKEAIDHCDARQSHWRAAMLAGGELHGGGGQDLGSAAVTATASSELFRLLENLGISRELEDDDDDGGGGGGDDGSDDGGGGFFGGGDGDGNAAHRGLWLATCFSVGREFAEDAKVAGFGSSGSSGGGGGGGGLASLQQQHPQQQLALSFAGGAGGGSGAAAVAGAGADSAVAALEGAVCSALAGDASTLLLQAPLPSASSGRKAVEAASSSPRGDYGSWEDKCWCVVAFFPTLLFSLNSECSEIQRPFFFLLLLFVSPHISRSLFPLLLFVYVLHRLHAL
jgi:hypothetical protein